MMHGSISRCRSKTDAVSDMNPTSTKQPLIQWHQIYSSSDKSYFLLIGEFVDKISFRISNSNLSVKSDFETCIRYCIHNGQKVNFWNDIWLGDVPSKQQFQTIFSVDIVQSVFISDYSGWESSLDFCF